MTADCALVISDVHQRLNWAQAVLDHEAGNYDHVVFLGDIASSHDAPPQVAGIRETARWYARLIERSDVTVILGNHESPLLECEPLARVYRKKRTLLHGHVGFRQNHALEFAKEVTAEHWKRVQLFALVNGWLCSHAGIHESFWRPILSDEGNLDRLWRDAIEALQLISLKRHPLLACGPGRSDTPDAEIAGCTWQDWLTEFDDSAPWPQLVGHSNEHDCVRRIGRSFCIDTGIGYALVRRDGSIEHKTLRCERVNGECQWRPGVPQFRDDSERPLARKHTVNANLLSRP